MAITGAFAFMGGPPELPPGRIAGALEADSSEFLEFPRAPEADPPPVPVAKNLFPAPLVSAAAVLIKDARSGSVIYGKNPQARLPIASLTKLMTALAVMEYGDLDDNVEISPTDLHVHAYRVDFSPGEKLTVRDLLAALLVSSANDAALALSRYASGSTENFVKDMNDKAAALGMRSTSFANPIGFDDPRHYSTAEDLAKLADEFAHYSELLDIVKIKSTRISSVSGRETRALATTNRLLEQHPEVVGLKTGYTAEAKGSLIILVDQSAIVPGPRYYSIILASIDRERETALLLDWVAKEFTWK